MGIKINLTGKIFGKLTVLEECEERTPQGSVQWKCQCECGNIVIVSGDNLRRNHTKSCGCIQKENGHKRLIDLTGQRFGYLEVLERSYTDYRRTVYWKCRCDCGVIKDIAGNSLRKGKTKSCGCQMAKKPQDLSNQKFGKLTAIKYIHKNNRVYWICQCECGNLTEVLSSHLLSKETQSCGCIGKSIGEYNIINILKENNIQYIQEYRFDDLQNYRFDFYLPELNRLIEFDGRQHYFPCGGVWDEHDSLQQRQQRDQIKNEYAFSNKIELVRIPYWERDKITLEMILGNKYLI